MQKDNPFAKHVEKGLLFLIRTQDKKTGTFTGGMYAHGLATIALCEAYSQTKDANLRRPAQFAINFPANATSPADPPLCSGTQTLYFDGQGQATTVIGANSRYRLIVTFVRNPTPTGATAPTYARLKASWPAAVDPCAVTPSGSIETFAAFDRN